MSIKNLSGKIEKELARTTESYESLIATMREYIEANMKAISDKMAKCGDILDAEIAKSNKTKGKPKKAAKKTATTKAPKAEKISGEGKPRGRKSGGGLLGHLVEILKDKPLTEPDIAKVLLENPEKYNWKNKSESTLYQTLRRGVKEKKIVESGDRNKETKTYHVA